MKDLQETNAVLSSNDGAVSNQEAAFVVHLHHSPRRLLLTTLNVPVIPFSFEMKLFAHILKRGRALASNYIIAYDCNNNRCRYSV
jgi:hypothetical protein